MGAEFRNSYRRLESLSPAHRGVEKRALARSALFAGIAAIFLATASPASLAATAIPLSLQLRYEEGKALLAQRKWPEAVIVLRSLLGEAPRYLPATIDLSRALVYAGRREEALVALAAAASREPASRREMLVKRAKIVARLFLANDDFQIYQEGLNFLQARKFGRARERFEVALEKEPDNAEILTRLGQCLVVEGDYDSAAERLKLARKLSPWEPEIHLWLGRALHQRGELKEAVTELRIASEMMPKSEWASVWLADALVSVNQRPAALQVLDRHLKSNPLHVQALYSLARFKYAALGREANSQALWNIRRDLQLALSRLDEYPASKQPATETELGLDLRNPETVRSDVDNLFRRVEARIQAGPSGTAVDDVDPEPSPSASPVGG